MPGRTLSGPPAFAPHQTSSHPSKVGVLTACDATLPDITSIASSSAAAANLVDEACSPQHHLT